MCCLFQTACQLSNGTSASPLELWFWEGLYGLKIMGWATCRLAILPQSGHCVFNPHGARHFLSSFVGVGYAHFPMPAHQTQNQYTYTYSFIFYTYIWITFNCFQMIFNCKYQDDQILILFFWKLIAMVRHIQLWLIVCWIVIKEIKNDICTCLSFSWPPWSRQIKFLWWKMKKVPSF